MPGVDVRYSGPIFGPAAASMIRRALVDAVKELGEKGTERLKTQAVGAPAGVFQYTSWGYVYGHVSRGNYRRNIHMEMRELNARIDDSSVIYGPWLEGTGSRNATSRFKGYGLFRKTQDWLNSQKDAVLNRHVALIVGELNGGSGRTIDLRFSGGYRPS